MDSSVTGDDIKVSVGLRHVQNERYKLHIRVETHDKLDMVFEGVLKTDRIRHFNVQLLEWKNNGWTHIKIPGTNTKNFHMMLP